MLIWKAKTVMNGCTVIKVSLTETSTVVNNLFHNRTKSWQCCRLQCFSILHGPIRHRYASVVTGAYPTADSRHTIHVTWIAAKKLLCLWLIFSLLFVNMFTSALVLSWCPGPAFWRHLGRISAQLLATITRIFSDLLQYLRRINRIAA
jgi:hypothetical protein